MCSNNLNVEDKVLNMDTITTNVLSSVKEDLEKSKISNIGEIIEFLEQSEARAAIELGQGGTWVYLDKNDFILELRYAQYSGTTCISYTYNPIFAVGHILYVPFGVSL